MYYLIVTHLFLLHILTAGALNEPGYYSLTSNMLDKLDTFRDIGENKNYLGKTLFGNK